MKAKWVLLLLFTVLVFSCSTAQQAEQEAENKREKTIFKWPEKIDYNEPQRYLLNGEISYISEETRKSLDEYILSDNTTLTDMELVRHIYRYMGDSDNFSHYAAGGKLIAKRTTEEIFSDKTLSGCHDWGLVLSTVLRSYGIPAIFCDTALVSWAESFIKEENNGFAGHIFVEAFIDDRWVLLNSTNPEIIYDYDPMNPLLGFQRDGSYHYVMFKGIDPWDYGVYGNEDMIDSMKNGASHIVQKLTAYAPNGSPERIDKFLQ